MSGKISSYQKLKLKNIKLQDEIETLTEDIQIMILNPYSRRSKFLREQIKINNG